MATKRVALIAAISVTMNIKVASHALRTRHEHILDDMIYDYEHDVHRVEVSSKEVEKIAPMFDSIYHNHADKNACIGGSAALKLYTKRDFTPSDIDIFTPALYNTSRDKTLKMIGTTLHVDNVKFAPQKYTNNESFDDGILDVIEFDFIKTDPPIRTQIINVDNHGLKAFGYPRSVPQR